MRDCLALLESEVVHASFKTSASSDQVAEVRAELSRVLFLDAPERPAALREYTGRGSLQSYLRIAATRALIRVVNRRRREVSDDDLLERLTPDHDPELGYLREHYRGVVDEAVRAAIAALPDRDRAVLRYQVVLGKTVDQVGVLYEVHRATAARWIAAAREDLGDRIREELARRLEVGLDEVDSVVRLVQSRVDVSLDRLLR